MQFVTWAPRVNTKLIGAKRGTIFLLASMMRKMPKDLTSADAGLCWLNIFMPEYHYSILKCYPYPWVNRTKLVELAHKLRKYANKMMTGHFLLADFTPDPATLSIVPPSPIVSFQHALFYAPRNILIRTPTQQIVFQYQQHETVYTFALRYHLCPF